VTGDSEPNEAPDALGTNLTLRFATDLLDIGVRGLDRASLKSGVELFVDGLAVATLGALEPAPQILAAIAQSKPQATVIGQGVRASVADAARINGAAMHVLDFEPMWNPANHAVSTTLPALLALAEQPGVPPSGLGKRLLTALATGIEAQARLRKASNQFEPSQVVFHPPGVVGPIGSAVASGIFRGLDNIQLSHAIGIAASRAGGILVNVGSMTKSLHCGQAAAAGLESALLSERGFTADRNALAGPLGFGSAFFHHSLKIGDLDASSSLLHIVEPGPAFKLYPSQYGTHFIITAALEARSKLPQGGRIERVRVLCPSMPYVDRPEPASGLAGKFSFQYTAGIALLDGEVLVSSFTDERRFRPDIVDLLKKVQLQPEPSRVARFDKMCVTVVVEMANGAVVEGSCTGPPGIWGRPLNQERLLEKARDCFTIAIGEKDAREALELACSVETLKGPQFQRLMSLVSQNAAAK
jgi:2-methylcitrate dehydratase PrpD